MKQNRQEVINKATHLFWEKGFHATSMRNLQEVIDMRPGSIYATFGSKEGLFKESLLHYGNQAMARLEACSKSESSPLNALKHFITITVLESCETAPSDMCMLVKTVAELTEENAELLAESKRLLKVIENGFNDLLIQAQEQGELDESKDTRRLARFLKMQLMGLRVYTRANNDAQVDELIDDVFICLH